MMPLVLRGVVVSLTTFAIIYLFTSTAAVYFSRWLASDDERRLVSLYAWRTAPLWVSFGTVLLFTIPGFFSFEPREQQEAIGWVAWSGSAAGAALLAIGFWRTLAACREARSFQRQFFLQVTVTRTCEGALIHVVRHETSAIMVLGLFRPIVLVSSAALELLDEAELAAAVRHEIAHANTYDNLKKLVLGFCGFPGFQQLEKLWLQDAEIAADSAATYDDASALDLASAILKMARFPTTLKQPRLSQALASGSGAAITKRVERLITYPRSSAVQGSADKRAIWGRICCVILGIGFVALNYFSLLARAQELSELLIK